ncbi:MAG: DNA repair protein RadC, partial [Porticoccaceae bacterium]|nr:DNA repair protein RadC [Porticoccaceae bacterium]
GERPREKLIQQGAASLSDTELLAIFLRTGSAGKTAVDLAREMLNHFGSLAGLLSANHSQFCALKGLGTAKFAQLQATLELARRHLKERMERHQVFTSPDAVASFLRLQLQGRQQEVFSALFLDSQHRLIAFEELFRGTIDSAAVYPREVVRRALAHNAAALILAHNHPSGVAEPSEADARITRQLKNALALVDVRVLDHMVVGMGEVVSLVERGKM